MLPFDDVLHYGFGLMTSYFYKFATGSFESGMTSEQVGGVFNELQSNPLEMVIWMAIITVLGFLVCSRGIQKGIEKVSKVMMIALLILILVLAGNSLFLSGAGEGLSFYLIPDLDKVNEIGLGNVISSAMNQAFFTLSLGIAAMEIFGSYMSKDHTLPSESIKICALDTFVAIMAGLIIFPACFSYGVQPDQGPALIFVTLPNVFVNMAGGRIWGTLFFLFMTLRASQQSLPCLKTSFRSGLICSASAERNRFSSTQSSFLSQVCRVCSVSTFGAVSKFSVRMFSVWKISS